MKLYMNPASSPSRAIMLFGAEAGVELDERIVDLMTGEHLRPDHLAINPSGMVPVLDDGGFVLTEGSAIMKYLADKVRSPLYPQDIQERARVNEAMDWFNTNLYRDLAFNLVYPQIFEHHARRSAEGTDAAVTWGLEKAQRWLGILDRDIIGPGTDHVCLGRLTIADLFGASLITIGEVIQLDLARHPNIDRWLAGLRSRESWQRVNGGFYGMVDAFKTQSFVAA